MAGDNSILKITSFHPVIMSTKADAIISLFEEMGFERKHFTQFGELGTTSAMLEDAKGFCVDVSQVDTLPHENRDLMSIRINVDDYEEAFEFFKAHGFTTPMGDTKINTGTSKGII
jgi:hypothetical protein